MAAPAAVANTTIAPVALDTTPAIVPAAPEPIVEASDLLASLGLTSDGLPVAPAKAKAQPKAATTPQKVKIGNQELTIPEIEAQLAKASTLTPQAQQALEVGNMFFALPENQRQTIMDVAESLSKGINPLEDNSRSLAVSPIDVPADATTPAPIPWKDMTEEGQYLYAMVAGVKEWAQSELKKIGGVTIGIAQTVGQLNQVTADENTARAMRTMGFTLSGSDIVDLRSKGIADPIAAAKAGLLKPSQAAAQANAQAQAAASKEEAPPEAPGDSAPKVIKFANFRGSIQQTIALVNAGYTFEFSSADEEASFRRNVLNEAA